MKFVDPKNDVAFRKIFGNDDHKDILIEFLNVILNLACPIKSVKIVNPFIYPLIKGLKETILDVHASDQDGNTFIIEMQMENASGFDKRIVYYSSKAYVKGLPKGKKYNQLKPVIFLGVLNFTMFDNIHYISRHLILNKETGSHDLKDLEFNFVELPKFTKDEAACQTLVEKWVYFLKNADNLKVIPDNVTSTALQHAYESAYEHAWTEEQLDLYDYQNMRIHQAWGKLDFAEKRGLKKGREEGDHNACLRIATSLLSFIDDASIANTTGLSVEEVKNLRQQHGERDV